MNGEQKSLRKRPSGGWSGAGWLAVAVAGAIGVIWILPAAMLRNGPQPSLRAIAAVLLLLRTLRSRRDAFGPLYAW